MKAKKEKDITFVKGNVCMFCGNEVKMRYDRDDDAYFECDCEDAVRDREIDDEISELENNRPKRKYKIEDVQILIKLN